ncbi:MAG: hypothetical protein LDL37_00665 [Asticcacaulis sp.]|uniref:hypothetical protein n=1 Tax=Asticcacaulis sp. TaxID=1872648 RepID=UPI0025BA91FE|nr:hypothetical protein [Asticcacaulis sp.]MCA1933932.1 hypothetical protein [Asticcacaulis sp.]
MPPVQPFAARRPGFRLGAVLTPFLIAALAACGGGGGGGGSGGSSGGVTGSSSSSSAAPTAYVGGSEFSVNTTVDNDQTYPAATTLNNGNVVVVWNTSLGVIGATALSEVRAQIFTPAGAKVGSEIIVSSGTPSSASSHRHVLPAVLATSDGGFAVAYISNGHNGNTTDTRITQGPIMVRAFKADGTPDGDAAIPPLTTTLPGEGLTGSAGYAFSLDMKSLSDGRIVVTWTEWGTSPYNDGNNMAVRMQLFKADGDELIPASIVNTQTVGQQSYSSVAALSGGGFVIIWTDYNGSNSTTQVAKLKGQRYDANGAKLGTEFLVRDTTLAQSVGSIAPLPNNQFVIVWSEGSRTSTDDDVWGQIFNGDATLSGAPFALATTTTNRQVQPKVIALANGHFFTFWGDNSNLLGDTDPYALTGQAFTSNGTKFGSQLLLNVTTAGSQAQPVATALKTEGFFMAWTDPAGDVNGAGVKARVFKLN